jgi:hypothetical protein
MTELACQDGPTIGVYVAFQSDATDSTPTWTDITEYVRSYTFSRGRQTELEQTEPGTASFILNNQDRRFDPFYASSPYYPYVEPMKQVRITATYSAVTYERWRGYVDSWPNSWDGNGKVAEVVMTATDAFKIFAKVKLPENAWHAQVETLNPTAWYKFSEPVGSTIAYDSSVNNHDGIYENVPTLALDGIMEEPGDDKAFSPLHDGGGQRMSVAEKDLIGGYPFSMSFVFRTESHRMSYKQILYAASVDQVLRSTLINVAIYGEPTGLDARCGKFVVTIQNPVGTNARAYYTPVVDDGERHCVVVASTDFSLSSSTKIYVDGVEVTTTTGTFGPGAPTFPPTTGLKGYAFGNTLKVSYGDFGFADVQAEGSTRDVIDDIALWDGVALSAQNAADLAFAMRGWEGELSSERVDRILDFAGWDVSLRDIDTGNTALMNGSFSGSVLDYLLKIAESENGNVYMNGDNELRYRSRHAISTNTRSSTSQATFGDVPASELPYADLKFESSDLHLRNVVTVTRDRGVPQQVIDATSRTRYQESPYQRTGQLMETDTEARESAQWILGHYKDPTERVAEIEIKPRRAAALWPEVLGRELEDRITIKRRPPGGGSTITHDALIEKMTESVTVNGNWTVTWALSPADTQSYLILDDPVFGLLDSGNLLGY